MENVTEGTNSTDKIEVSVHNEAVCSNGDKGSEGGDEPAVAEAGDVKVTPETPPVSSSFRLRPPVTGLSIQPPRITFDPPKLVLPASSDLPSSSDVSSSKSVLGGGGFGASFGSNRAFKLNPPRLSNPFAKTVSDGEPESINSSESGEIEDKTTSSSSNFTVAFVPLGASNSTIGGPPGGGGGGGGSSSVMSNDTSSNVTSTVAADSTSIPLSPSSPAVNSSVPVTTASSLSNTTAAASSTSNSDLNNSTNTMTSSTSSSSFSFVFGQNIRDKVEVVATAAVDTNEPSSTTPDTKEVTANGTSTSEMLFSAQVKNTDKSNDSGGKTLSEAAREYEEARNVKRKFDEVPVLTGEEEEANVLQINCKLFAWNNNSWTERGRGTLRVNDFPNIPSQHRLIVRTAGSLRVVLNTKIWSGMTVDRASAKSMRITAMDSSGLVKVFLVMAGSKEMDQLQKCLDWRVNNLKKLGDPTALKKTKVDENVTDKS